MKYVNTFASRVYAYIQVTVPTVDFGEHDHIAPALISSIFTETRGNTRLLEALMVQIVVLHGEKNLHRDTVFIFYVAHPNFFVVQAK